MENWSVALMPLQASGALVGARGSSVDQASFCHVFNSIGTFALTPLDSKHAVLLQCWPEHS